MQRINEFQTQQLQMQMARVGLLDSMPNTLGASKLGNSGMMVIAGSSDQ